jgi:hypothetical protein
VILHGVDMIDTHCEADFVGVCVLRTLSAGCDVL